MTYEFYKTLHLIGVITLFTSLGAAALANATNRKVYAALHGLASAIILIAGFGLLARIGMDGGFSPWVIIKLLMWIILGGVPVLLRRKPEWAFKVLLGAVACGGVAVWAAVFKLGS